MRAMLLALASILTMALGAVPAADAQTAPPAPSALTTLDTALAAQQKQLGIYSGADVVDLTTGQPLFAYQPSAGRTPASVEKLYTTTTALLKFGPAGTLTTSLLGTGGRGRTGIWYGTLYLRGGGDPTFGSSAFDTAYYGGGATIQQLVANLEQRAHLTALRGRIVGDATAFDWYPGTIEDGFAFDPYMEGSLSALAFNRGIYDYGQAYIHYPAIWAAEQLAAALRAVHVRLPRHLKVSSGRTPAAARVLATVSSPPMSTLIALTNTPSDNFLAEMLTKDLGLHFGTGGTTAAGVAVIRAELQSAFALTPFMDDGSGLSRDDSTSPEQVVTLLSDMATNTTFVDSLAIMGETGTLQDEARHTVAQGDCRGKTGTLSDVASLAGYCRAADGHTLAFAVLANRLGNADLGHEIEAKMAVAMAKYDG